MRIRAKLGAAVVLAVAALTLMPGVASAHEEKHVGPYLLAVGFGTEPDAYAGYPNSVQLLLSKNDKPVVDLDFAGGADGLEPGTESRRDVREQIAHDAGKSRLGKC
jgi:hypothetical protein